MHDTPEYNGISERLNQTLLERTRTLLHLVSIPGNPRVNFSDPYPYPLKPGPLVNGSRFNWVRVKGSQVSQV